MELKKLYNDIKNSYNDYNKSEFRVNRYKLPFNKSINDNKFVGKLDFTDYKNIYYIDIDNNKIWFITNKIKLDKKLVDKIINRIISFKKYSKNRNHNNIYIWLSPYKKYLPSKKGDIIDVINVNSGSSIVYNPSLEKNGDIEIWRKEEVLKVLVHELLHSLKYDYYLQNDMINRMIKREFNVNEYINANESYTETLATIINCIYYTIENDKTYEYFLSLILNEQEHIKNQTNKILEHYGYNNIKELYRKNSNTIFKQKTNVFSYYILKCVLLNNIIMFCKFKIKKDCNKKYYKLILDSFDKCIINKISYGDNNLKMTIT